MRPREQWALVVAFVFAASTAAGAAGLTTERDGVKLELRSEPEQPTAGKKTSYVLQVGDSTGAPVADARVTLTGRMPDGMSIAAPLRATATPGIYRGEVLFTMEGSWQLRLRVGWQDRRVEVPFDEKVAR